MARHLELGDMSREHVLAAAFRLLDLGLFRVGGETYATDNGSFGLATVERRHVRVGAEGISFDYVAKSGKRRRIVLQDEQCAKVVTTLKRRRDDGEGGEDLLAWRVADGGRTRWRDVTSSDINDYVHEVVGPDTSAKDFRTWHGTVLAARSLAVAGEAAEMSKTRRTRAVAAVMREVAEHLGNTPSVARASYVDPRVVDLWEDGIAITPVVEALGADGAADVTPGERSEDAQEALERAVLELLTLPPLKAQATLRRTARRWPPGRSRGAATGPWPEATPRRDRRRPPSRTGRRRAGACRRAAGRRGRVGPGRASTTRTCCSARSWASSASFFSARRRTKPMPGSPSTMSRRSCTVSSRACTSGPTWSSWRSIGRTSPSSRCSISGSRSTRPTAASTSWVPTESTSRRTTGSGLLGDRGDLAERGQGALEQRQRLPREGRQLLQGGPGLVDQRQGAVHHGRDPLDQRHGPVEQGHRPVQQGQRPVQQRERLLGQRQRAVGQRLDEVDEQGRPLHQALGGTRGGRGRRRHGLDVLDLLGGGRGHAGHGDDRELDVGDDHAGPGHEGLGLAGDPVDARDQPLGPAEQGVGASHQPEGGGHELGARRDELGEEAVGAGDQGGPAREGAHTPMVRGGNHDLQQPLRSCIPDLRFPPRTTVLVPVGTGGKPPGRAGSPGRTVSVSWVTRASRSRDRRAAGRGLSAGEGPVTASETAAADVDRVASGRHETVTAPLTPPDM